MSIIIPEHVKNFFEMTRNDRLDIHSPSREQAIEEGRKEYKQWLNTITDGLIHMYTYPIEGPYDNKHATMSFSFRMLDLPAERVAKLIELAMALREEQNKTMIEIKPENILFGKIKVFLHEDGTSQVHYKTAQVGSRWDQIAIINLPTHEKAFDLLKVLSD